MPPEQGKRLSDIVDQLLGFGAHRVLWLGTMVNAARNLALAAWGVIGL
jgi:hypothetical protein